MDGRPPLHPVPNALVDSAGLSMDATARLAQEGEEWLPGREYELLEKIGGAGAAGEGTESIVFKIRLLRAPRETYALKQLVLYDMRGEFRDDAKLNAKLGREWRVALSLPPHECIVPVLHHYNSSEPSLRDPRWGLPDTNEWEREMRDAAATRTLFVVMPLYRTSLRAWVSAQRTAGLAPPYNMSWQWWGKLLTRILRAVEHLIRNGAVHGDIKDDQCFLCDGFEQSAEVVLGDLGEAWRTVNADGSDRVLQESDFKRRAGVGVHQAPELRPERRGEHPPGSPLSKVFGLAESFTVGVMMYGLLDCWSQDDVFHRAAGLGQPPLPGCAWDDAELPSLPPDCPVWLAEVIRGLARSTTKATTAAAAAAARISAAQAIDRLGVEQVARTMGELEQSRATTAAIRRQLQEEQQQLEVLRRQAADAALVQEQEAAEARRREIEATQQLGAAAEHVAEERRRWEATEAATAAAAAVEVAEKEAEVRELHARIARMEEGSQEDRLRAAEREKEQAEAEKEQAVQSLREWQAAAQARDTAATGGAAVAAGLLESVKATGAQLLGAAGEAWAGRQETSGNDPPPVADATGIEPPSAAAARGNLGAELEEVSWARFEMLGGRQHLLLAFRSGGVQLWDLDDDVQVGRNLRGAGAGAASGSGSSNAGGAGGTAAARLVLSRRKIGEPGEVVRCGVCLDPASVTAAAGAGTSATDSATVLLALSMTLPSSAGEGGPSSGGGMIRFLPVPGIGELPPFQTLAPVDTLLANGAVLVAMMAGGSSGQLLQVWSRHTPDQRRHPNPAGLLTQSIETASTLTSDSHIAANSAPAVALGSRWLAYAALPPDATTDCCPEPLCVRDEPTFVTTTTTQAVEVADTAVSSLYWATRSLASNAAATIAPHIRSLVSDEAGAASDSDISPAVAAPIAEPEPEPEPEPGLMQPAPVVEPGTGGAEDEPRAECGWVGVRQAVGFQWVAHFRAAATPVVALELSPSSRLLACVANDGRDIELWRIQPQPASADVQQPPPAVCVGHMLRGSRPSTVVDLSFSTDERHLVVCSGSKGTVHVFALRPVVAGGAYRHTAHAKIHLPSWLESLGLWGGLGAAGAASATATAAETVTPLRAAFAPLPLQAAQDVDIMRPARVLVLSPPGQLRLAELKPAVGGASNDPESALKVVQLYNDGGAAAVGRRQLDPDISTPITVLEPAAQEQQQQQQQQAFAGCVRPTHAPRSTPPLWSMPGVRTGPAGQPPETWTGLGGREWVGGMLQAADGGDDGEFVEASGSLGNGMMGVMNIDDHFEVPLPPAGDS
eukprot:COSAG06_NODE_453_length_15545_cov_11.398032_11_plen_1295_part_00